MVANSPDSSTQPPAALWAQAFADAYLELSKGQGDEHALLDWAYELYPARGQQPGGDVAREEFVKANPGRNPGK